MANKRKIPERRETLKSLNIDLDIYGKMDSTGNKLLPVENEKVFIDEVIIESLNYKELFNLTENNDINDFLTLKAVELYKLYSKTALELGKIFKQVEEKLGGVNHYNGVYTKWLNKNGFNKMTALRYKRRYKLYEQLETVVGKNLLMTLSQKIIDEISLKSEIEIQEYLKMLDNGKTKLEIQEYLKNKDCVILENDIIRTFDFNKEYQRLNEVFKKISIQDFNDKKKENLEKDIQRIEKILEKYL